MLTVCVVRNRCIRSTINSNPRVKVEETRRRIGQLINRGLIKCSPTYTRGQGQGQGRLFASIPNRIYPSQSQEKNDSESAPIDKVDLESALSRWSPPRSLWRGISVVILAGQIIIRIIQGKVHKKNTLQQLQRVGPKSLGVCILTSTFVGMAFTIQFVGEFTRLGLTRSVGGVLALAFSRELSPVVISIVVAGCIGSAFAANELGAMQVSEQTDTLRVFGTDPVDYLVTPRVIACVVALPILTLICFMVGMAAGAFLSDLVYGVSVNIILDSVSRALKPWDIISAMIKSKFSEPSLLSALLGVLQHLEVPRVLQISSFLFASSRVQAIL